MRILKKLSRHDGEQGHTSRSRSPRASAGCARSGSCWRRCWQRGWRLGSTLSGSCSQEEAEDLLRGGARLRLRRRDGENGPTPSQLFIRRKPWKESEARSLWAGRGYACTQTWQPDRAASGWQLCVASDGAREDTGRSSHCRELSRKLVNVLEPRFRKALGTWLCVWLGSRSRTNPDKNLPGRHEPLRVGEEEGSWVDRLETPVEVGTRVNWSTMTFPVSHRRDEQE